MSSTELFKKHFGNQLASVDLKHPNMEKFFDELNEECLLEDRQKQCDHSWVYKILHDHTPKNVCEKCHLVSNKETPYRFESCPDYTPPLV